MTTEKITWSWDQHKLHWWARMPDGVVLRAQLAKQGRHVNRWLAVVDDETLSWTMHEGASAAQDEALDCWRKNFAPRPA